MLFLASHTSRGNPISLKRFQNENVTIIAFQGQITNVIQPFDATVNTAGPKSRQVEAQLLHAKKSDPI